MEAVKMLKERRSVRQFTDQKVDREILKEIVDSARYAPSWANFQIARYTVVDSKEVLKQMADNGFGVFKQNSILLNNAVGTIVVSVVKGKSGTGPTGAYVTKKEDTWEMFDAGIAAQTLCLAAHEKDLGTVILGLFDEDKIAEIIDLPKNEVITAIIPYGYPKVQLNAPKRFDVEEIIRYK
jgi:nitroreductase